MLWDSKDIIAWPLFARKFSPVGSYGNSDFGHNERKHGKSEF